MTGPTAKKKDFFLIDGYALIYRFYFAFIKSRLGTRRGEDTGAIFGLTTFLLRLREQYEPDYWVVVLDTKAPTFRHRLYPDYKATREKMPDDLQQQIPRIREVLSALRVPVLEMEGYEADDIIGTLSRKVERAGMRAVIVSGDKDFCQLVDEDVVLLKPGKRNAPDEWVDRRGVVEKLGVPPERVADLFALMGDSSDNVPGVPGIGRKRAETLVRRFGGLSDLFRSLESVDSKHMREALESNRDLAFLSRELVTLEVDIPAGIDLDDFRRSEPETGEMARIFRELEFYSLLRDHAVNVSTGGGETYTALSSYPVLESFIREVVDAGRLAIDVEATDRNPMSARLVGISLAVEEGKAYYVPLAHTSERPLPREKAIEALRPIIESPGIEKVGQNLKYDLKVLRREGLRLDGISFDTMIASYLLEPGRKSHGLDYLVAEFLGHRMIPFADVVREGRMTFADVPLTEATRYSCEDVDYTLRLANRFRGMLEERRLYSLFKDVEVPLITVLAEMELTGVSIDCEFFEYLSKRLEHEMKYLEEDVYTLAGEEFNINSHPQLSRILFEKLGLPARKKTKTGFSTDSEVLAKLAEQHQLPRLLLDYRELSKLKSTYVDALPRQVDPNTGRIHTSYNQVVTSTGRLSSSGPNLQNIPVRTPIGREIRKGFKPGGEDRLFLSADYSQIELRLMAHLSKDREMVRAFRAGEDIHRQTAALVFGVPYEKVSGLLRSRAKEVNFGIIYGMGAFGLARRLNISVEEAGAFISDYFKRFSGVKEFMDRMIREAEERGYVTTIMGRRRYLPDLNHKSRSVREFARRTAINSPVQGSAADIIKIAMIDIFGELARRVLKSRMIIQVHDELVFEVYKDELEEVKELVKEKMEQAIVLRVPVVVDVSTGSNWFECKEGA